MKLNIIILSIRRKNMFLFYISGVRLTHIKVKVTRGIV